jgi:hypothetical protein
VEHRLLNYIVLKSMEWKLQPILHVEKSHKNKDRNSYACVINQGKKNLTLINQGDKNLTLHILRSLNRNNTLLSNATLPSVKSKVLKK